MLLRSAGAGPSWGDRGRQPQVTVRPWDTLAAECVCTVDLKQACGVSRVVFSHSGDWIIAACRDGNVCVWGMKSGACLGTLRGHSKCVTSARSFARWRLGGHCFRRLRSEAMEHGAGRVHAPLWRTSWALCLSAVRGVLTRRGSCGLSNRVTVYARCLA